MCSPTFWHFHHFQQHQLPGCKSIDIKCSRSVVIDQVLQSQKVFDPLARMGISTFFQQEHEGLNGSLRQETLHAGATIVALHNRLSILAFRRPKQWGGRGGGCLAILAILDGEKPLPIGVHDRKAVTSIRERNFILGNMQYSK